MGLCGAALVVAATAGATQTDPLAIQNISIEKGAPCAVRGDGAAKCWGTNYHPWNESHKAVTGPLKQLVAAFNFKCALSQADKVYCWGEGDGVEVLGRGGLTDQGDPGTPVAVLSNVQQIDLKNRTVCALTQDGDVYCWGGGTTGEASEALVDRPTQIMGLPKIKQVSVGYSQRCAVGVDSSVWCWGYFKDGSDGTGRGTAFRSAHPFRVEIPMGGATQVSAGYYSSCAISVRSASVFCWGLNEDGQIGNNDKGNNALIPKRVWLESGEMARQVSVGPHYACAMLTSGAARCWGTRDAGVLGNGTGSIWGHNGYETRPVMVQNSQGEFFGFKGIVTSHDSGSYNTTCAWGEGNQAWCWGEGGNGQLGDGDSGLNVYVNTPKRVRAIDSGWQ